MKILNFVCFQCFWLLFPIHFDVLCFHPFYPFGNTAKRGGSPSCTRIIESTITIPSVSRNDQDLKLSCFVLNDDYNSVAPGDCSDPSTQLCDVTSSIRIYCKCECHDPTAELPTFPKTDFLFVFSTFSVIQFKNVV